MSVDDFAALIFSLTLNFIYVTDVFVHSFTDKGVHVTMTMHDVLGLTVLLYMLRVVSLQPATARDIITEAVLSNFGDLGVPFPLPVTNGNGRVPPNDVLNLGESFFLSRLCQGDSNALMHLNQLQQSVDNPFSTIHELFHTLRRPSEHRGSNIFGLLHNFAVARGLIPNTHAFVVRKPELQQEINRASAIAPPFESQPSDAAKVRGASTIEQQILDTVNKGNASVNVTSPMSNNSDTQVNEDDDVGLTTRLNIDSSLPAIMGNTLETRLNNKHHGFGLNSVQHDIGTRTNNTGGRLWHTIAPPTNGNSAILNTAPLSDLLTDITSTKRENTLLSELFTTKIPMQTIAQTLDLDAIPDKNDRKQTNRETNRQFKEPFQNVPFASLRIGKVALQPIYHEPTPDSKQVGQSSMIEGDTVLELPKGVEINNRSVIVADSRMELGRLMEIDVFSDNKQASESAKREFILQEVGELDLRPKDVTYQYVGDMDVHIPHPNSVVQRFSELNFEHNRKFVMQIDGDSGRLDNTAVAQKIGPSSLLPGEVIRVHGNGATRLVTKERVVIERLGFVKFQTAQPLGVEKRTYRLNYVTVPVLRVDVSRKNFIIANHTDGKDLDKNGVSTHKPQLQYVGDMLTGSQNNDHAPFFQEQDINTSLPTWPLAKETVKQSEINITQLKDNLDNNNNATNRNPVEPRVLSALQPPLQGQAMASQGQKQPSVSQNIRLGSRGRFFTLADMLWNETDPLKPNTNTS